MIQFLRQARAKKDAELAALRNAAQMYEDMGSFEKAHKIKNKIKGE